MFKERLISGVIVLAIAIAAILLGGYVLFFFTAAISLIGLFEYYRALQMEKNPTAIAGYCGWAVLYLLLFFGIPGAPMMGHFRGLKRLRYSQQLQALLMLRCLCPSFIR